MYRESHARRLVGDRILVDFRQSKHQRHPLRHAFICFRILDFIMLP